MYAFIQYMSVCHTSVYVYLYTLLKLTTHFQQVMHLPCDVQHVVSCSSLLNNTQSSQQTHRCAQLGDVQRHGEWFAGIAVQQYNDSAMYVGRVQFDTLKMKSFENQKEIRKGNKLET